MATVKEKRILYDNKEHLKELVKELVTLHKEDGYDNFEEISMFVREKNTKLDSFQYRIPNKKIKKTFEHTPLEDKFLTEFSQKKKQDLNGVESVLVMKNGTKFV